MLQRKELTPEEEGEAQRLAGLVRHTLGTTLSAKKLNVMNSTLYRWSMGQGSPSRVRFDKLKAVAKEFCNGKKFQ